MDDNRGVLETPPRLTIVELALVLMAILFQPSCSYVLRFSVLGHVDVDVRPEVDQHIVSKTFFRQPRPCHPIRGCRSNEQRICIIEANLLGRIISNITRSS